MSSRLNLPHLTEIIQGPDHTIVVGDMPVDIAMGIGAGCRSIGVTYGNSNRPDLIKAGADMIIDTFPDLIDCIKCPDK